jgi:hypothetical protein
VTRAGSVPEDRKGEARRKPEVAIRVASAVVLAALALGAAAQPWSFLLLVMVGGRIVAWEWGGSRAATASTASDLSG